jgi:hypothetical protein
MSYATKAFETKIALFSMSMHRFEDRHPALGKATVCWFAVLQSAPSL